MTTAIKKNKTNILSRRVLSDEPVNASSVAKSAKQDEAVGLMALWNAPSPGLFENVAEVDAHIREGRGDWDDEE